LAKVARLGQLAEQQQVRGEHRALALLLVQAAVALIIWRRYRSRKTARRHLELALAAT
jgi:heme A synthase